MDEQKAAQLVEELRKKLTRTQRQMAGLKEKAKYLEMQYDDARVRESNSSELVMELIERQHELNVMLNRAQTMLSRTQEAMALTSLEFNEMAKALPEPKKAEFSDRISKINELFKKTGIEDGQLLTLDGPADESQDSTASEDAGSCVVSDEDRPEQVTVSRWEMLWRRKHRRNPPEVSGDMIDDSAQQGVESAVS